jgi:hypothetical protein
VLPNSTTNKLEMVSNNFPNALDLDFGSAFPDSSTIHVEILLKLLASQTIFIFYRLPGSWHAPLLVVFSTNYVNGLCGKIPDR